MPKRIPIADAKRIVQKHKLRQLVLVAWDGEKTHVVTYGTSLLDSEQAALGGNNVKKWLGWPESLCTATPARVKTRIQQLEQNAQRLLDFLGSLPDGWLGKTSGDIGLLNEAYIEARRLGLKVT